MSISPDVLFGELLSRPLHHPLNWPQRAPKRDELTLEGGIKIEDTSPPFTGGGLENALVDFVHFLKLQSIAVHQEGKAPKLRLIKLAGRPKARTRVTVSPHGITISADSAEGLRRGLIWIEDEMQAAEGPFLPLGKHEQREVIRTRISRCFYGPIQRPPLNRNELADEVNYYPDGYLNRLAHDGVTALWITIKFRESVPSKLFPEFGANASKYLAKLRETVERCARFGIKVYVFCIEPAALPIDSPILDRYPELRGVQVGEQVAFCTESEVGQSYLEEATATLFEQVLGLGGLIVIPVGERLTSCASYFSSLIETCPRCGKVGRNRVLYGVLNALRKGMARVAPDAELIAWPYGQMIFWGPEGMVEAAQYVPEGVTLQHNYETGGVAMQLGKPRPLWDYWLSWAGVSSVFQRASTEVLTNGGRVGAKLQVGNSHENATVPFLPVPGLLYRKYRAMHQLGVTSAMQSWYFGNYPSLMTRAAGLLSYAPLPSTEEEFLLKLAGREWGRHAREVALAWKCFGKGYENFPATHVFSYYGPVQNGVTWPLYLTPKRLPLSPSWKIDFPPSGDYLPHCFSHYFTLKELIVLCRRMVSQWQKGCQYLEKAYRESRKSEAQTHEWNIAEAIRLQLENALAILQFYQLREKLVELESKTERLDTLREMAEIVRAEIQRRREFLPLLDKEPTLGYHSEAEGFKITPALVEDGIEKLESLLKEEFPAIRKLTSARGSAWFGEYTGRAPGATPQATLTRLATFPNEARWAKSEAYPLRYWVFQDSKIAVTRERSRPEKPARDLAVKANFRILATRSELCFRVKLAFSAIALEGWDPSVVIEIEPSRMQPRRKFTLDADGEIRGYYEEGYLKPNPVYQADWTPSASGREASLVIPVETLAFPRGRKPFRMNIAVQFFHRATGEIRELSWTARQPMKARLIWGTTNPATDYGWAIPSSDSFH